MSDTYQTILRYLYESNKIPVWIFDKKKLIFSPLPQSDLRGEGSELYAVFGNILKDNTETPAVHGVAGPELLASFRFGDENGRRLDFVAGPVFLFDIMQSSYKKRMAVDFIYTKESFRKRVTDTPTVGLSSFCRFVQAAAALLLGKIPSVDEIKSNVGIKRIEDMTDSALSKAIFDIREEELVSLYTLENEKRLLDAIKEGDASKLMIGGALRSDNNRQRSQVASQTKHQFEYEVVALVAIVTRAAVEGGLDIDTAFSLSDLYLHRIDNHKTPRELVEIAHHAIRTFCEKVAESKAENFGKCSPHIYRSIKYIRAHLHYPISLEEVSEHVNINAKYLSRSFLKETGMKFTEFIQRERVREACVLLRTTEMSCIEIATTLAFSSQSYFIKVFSSVMQITPQKYRAEGKRYKEIK